MDSPPETPTTALGDPAASLDRQDLLEILPYGEAFLFVDRVEKITDHEIEATYRVPEDSSLLRAHFVDFPLMPGVLTGEGLAQAGAVLVRRHIPDHKEKHLLAMKIREATFFGLARPGETLVYRVALEKLGSKMAKLRGEARVGDRLVARAQITLAVVSRNDLGAAA